MIRKTLYKLFCWVRDYASVDAEGESIGYANSVKRRRHTGPLLSHSDNSIRSTGMTFYMYAATGGTVIETSFYNEKNDRNDNQLYIIPEGENFSEVLGQIVSMERIKSWH